MTERELIDAALKGDRLAEKTLFDAHVDRVFGLTFRMCGDKELAEDLTQETFVRAFTHLPGFRRQSAFSTWLHSITMSVTLNGLRKVKKYRAVETDIDNRPQIGDSKMRTDNDLKRSLQGAIDRLSDRLKAVFILYEVEGYRHGEIATILDVPEGTSKARLARAKEKLRDALGETMTRYAGEEGS
jgi:RNA polymerase sigma-70 factor, ECF subfamily